MVANDPFSQSFPGSCMCFWETSVIKTFFLIIWYPSTAVRRLLLLLLLVSPIAFWNHFWFAAMALVSSWCLNSFDCHVFFNHLPVKEGVVTDNSCQFEVMLSPCRMDVGYPWEFLLPSPPYQKITHGGRELWNCCFLASHMLVFGWSERMVGVFTTRAEWNIVWCRREKML